MGENEPDLTLTDELSLRGATAPLVSRAWAALTEWEKEDVLVGFLLVPIAVAVGGMLALALLLAVTLFAPALAAWLIWLAVRAAARDRLVQPAGGSTA